MTEYRISKYNPNLFVNGVYSRNEWTSYSDIGKKFDAGILLMSQYESIENKYLVCLEKLFKVSKVDTLLIKKFEASESCSWHKGLSLSVDESLRFIKDCLREKCWGLLYSKVMTLYVGYDYYIHVKTSMNQEILNAIVQEDGLYCNRYISK